VQQFNASIVEMLRGVWWGLAKSSRDQ